MELFGSNFNLFGLRKREATPAPVTGAPGVPDSTMPKGGSVTGAGSYQERIVYARDPITALTVSAVYRAVELRAKTIGVMPVQYRKKDFEKGNTFHCRSFLRRHQDCFPSAAARPP